MALGDAGGEEGGRAAAAAAASSWWRSAGEGRPKMMRSLRDEEAAALGEEMGREISPSSGRGQRAKEEEDVGVEGGREGFLRWEGRDGEDAADAEVVFMGSNGSLSMGWGGGEREE